MFSQVEGRSTFYTQLVIGELYRDIISGKTMSLFGTITEESLYTVRVLILTQPNFSRNR